MDYLDLEKCLQIVVNRSDIQWYEIEAYFFGRRFREEFQERPRS